MRNDGCIEPIILEMVSVLEVSLSNEVIIGAVALRSSSSVLLTLLPAALGLALGAGQGSTIAKSLLPSHRLPARLAAIVVLVGCRATHTHKCTDPSALGAQRTTRAAAPCVLCRWASRRSAPCSR